MNYWLVTGSCYPIREGIEKLNLRFQILCLSQTSRVNTEAIAF